MPNISAIFNKGSSIVGTRILPNNRRFPSPECYTTFWRITIYSDTLYWWDITPIFYPLLIWTSLPNLTFYLIVWGFHRTFATCAVCQQRTLTLPDAWFRPTLGLACPLYEMSNLFSEKAHPSTVLGRFNTPYAIPLFSYTDTLFKWSRMKIIKLEFQIVWYETTFYV